MININFRISYIIYLIPSLVPLHTIQPEKFLIGALPTSKGA